MAFKNFIKKIIPRCFLNLLRNLIVPEKLALMEEDLKSIFLWQYRGLASNISQRDDLRHHEFKFYSKVGEDGLISYIFSKVGVTGRTFVELGVEDGRECNTANLSLNFGWRGLLIDADRAQIERAQHFYQEKLGKNAARAKAVPCFVTAENINQLIKENGFEGEVDLVSIDIDGNDYWVWQSLNVVRPRLAVAEYNASFGLEPITIKYNPNFHYQKQYQKAPLYFGASLSALVKLFRTKGYLLVGCDSHGHDAFFVRRDVAEGKFIELSAEEAFYPNPYDVKTIGSTEKQFEQIKHLDFDHV